MQIVIEMNDEQYYEVCRGDSSAVLVPKGDLINVIRNGTPLESYLPNERCDTCKYVDCSIDNEPCIDCKVPHKSFYEPRQELECEVIDKAIKASEQQPKIGHWIIIDDCEQFIAKCSECGRTEDSRMISKYPYCHCGAKMEVKE